MNVFLKGVVKSILFFITFLLQLHNKTFNLKVAKFKFGQNWQ